MPITDLKVRELRNIANAEITLSAEKNIIVGANASGKTSLLEAIYFLCVSKSFRTTRPAELIREGQSNFQVISRHHSGDMNEAKVFGVARERTRSTIKYAGETISKTGEQARIQPVVIITPDCHQVITGPPNRRRSLIDWIMFHVEHDYYKKWQRYNKVLKQRNALLKKRAGGKELKIWDEKLVETAEVLERARENSISRLLDKLKEILIEIHNQTIDFHYEKGWEENTLSESLSKTYKKDIFQGFTSKGPHRADLRIHSAGKIASKVLSRGQTKILAFAIELAKTRLLSEATGKDAILLIDDLAAELDQERKETIEGMLRSSTSQILITSVDMKQLPETYIENSKVFHVEHGQFSEVVY